LGATPVPKITKSAGMVSPVVNSTDVTLPYLSVTIDLTPVLSWNLIPSFS